MPKRKRDDTGAIYSLKPHQHVKQSVPLNLHFPPILTAIWVIVHAGHITRPAQQNKVVLGKQDVLQPLLVPDAAVMGIRRRSVAVWIFTNSPPLLD